MPQPTPKAWKKAAFTAIAQIDRAVRGGHRIGPTEFQKIRNFLVLQYESPLGSVVHATPLFEALKHAIPDAHITVAASAMAISVLGHNPDVDRCVLTPDPFRDFRPSVHAVRACFAALPPGPRAILTTIGNQRTRLALLSRMAGRAVRAGYTLAPELYDVPLHFDPEHGQIEGNLDILRSLGHAVAFCEPRVFFTPQDAAAAHEMLVASIDSPESPRIAFVTQNSGGQPNQWGQDRFRQVVAELAQSCGAIPVFLGTAADAAVVEALRRGLPHPGISLAGKTTIPQLAAVLAQCDLAVSLDTGTFHVARAVDLPGVVIAPAWQSPLEWLPVAHPRYRVLRGASIPKPPPGYCIEEVGVGQVIEAALDLLRCFPPADLQREARLRNSISSRSALRQ